MAGSLLVYVKSIGDHFFDDVVQVDLSKTEGGSIVDPGMEVFIAT